jgi:hypothetical protein
MLTSKTRNKNKTCNTFSVVKNKPVILYQEQQKNLTI